MPVQLKAYCESLDAEIDSRFGAPHEELCADARRHLAECERCRKLYSYLFAPFPRVSMPAELEGRIGKTLQSSLPPVKPAGSAPAIASRFFLIFILAAILVAGTIGLTGWRLMNRSQLVAVASALMLGAVLLSFSLAWQMTPGSLRRISASRAITILALLFLLTVAILFPWHTPEGFFRLGWRCLKMGFTMAVPAAAVFGILVRRGAPLGPGTLGGTLGAIAGLLAITVLQFTCDTQEAIHLLVWHGAVLGLCAVTGFLIGQSVGIFRR
jgi:hypothetical protein